MIKLPLQKRLSNESRITIQRDSIVGVKNFTDAEKLMQLKR